MSSCRATNANARVFALVTKGVSNAKLGEKFGGELAGAQARTGVVVLTAAEVIDLALLLVAIGFPLELLRDRIAHEMTVDTASPAVIRALKGVLMGLDIAQLHASELTSI